LPSSYVVLAYRRVGLKAPTRLASIVGPIAAILVAVMGFTFLALTPAHPNERIVDLLTICWGLSGIIRLRRAVAAKRLLTEWEPSVQDFDAKPALPKY
jgi:O-antigen ligase